MERDCESELSKLNIEQNACIYHFGASVIHGQRSNILRLHKKGSIFHNKTVRMIEPGAENILVKESLFYLRTQENLTWQILE